MCRCLFKGSEVWQSGAVGCLLHISKTVISLKYDDQFSAGASN